jgi:hypothetical protein
MNTGTTINNLTIKLNYCLLKDIFHIISSSRNEMCLFLPLSPATVSNSCDCYSPGTLICLSQVSKLTCISERTTEGGFVLEGISVKKFLNRAENRPPTWRQIGDGVRSECGGKKNGR